MEISEALSPAGRRALEAASRALGRDVPALAGAVLEAYAGLWSRRPWPAPEKVRDLTRWPLLPGVWWVVACDSDGGIGPKPHDAVRVPGYVLGRFAARVPLLELLAAGARPLVVADTLGVELEPTGREIIRGVADEVRAAGLDPDAALTGSTEDNVPTVATGVGVTVLGVALASEWRVGSSQPGDAVVCVGVPKSAPADEVRPDDPAIMDPAALCRLLGLDGVRDVLPVGSRGIGHEARELARTAGLAVRLHPTPRLDLGKSGGPGTAVLAAVDPARVAGLQAAVERPVAVVGHLER